MLINIYFIFIILYIYQPGWAVICLRLHREVLMVLHRSILEDENTEA